MKKKKFPYGIFLAITILLTACSQEDEPLVVEQEKAYLSFKTLLPDPGNQQIPEENPNTGYCENGVPVFVEIILTYGDIYVAGSSSSPHRIAINTSGPNIQSAGISSFLTRESAALKLDPGEYSLEYFTVLDAEENIIWIAPMNDNKPGGFDDLVLSLPMNITLSAGNQYQDVEVICFDERYLNDYGYLFYELNGTRVIEFCIFGNYCNAQGRHGEIILFEVDIWKYSGDPSAPKGVALHENEHNEVIVIDYEDYSETISYPLCLTLPDGPGLDEYYIEITRVGLGMEDELIRSGLISDTDVRDLFRENGSMDYYHFIEGDCNDDDEPVLLSDQRDITGFTWEFTFIFGGDALLAADVVFYPDGTATYNLYGDPNATVWGTWSYYDNILFYDPDGDDDFLGYDNLSGKYIDGVMSGTFGQGGFEQEWYAYKKVEQ